MVTLIVMMILGKLESIRTIKCFHPSRISFFFVEKIFGMKTLFLTVAVLLLHSLHSLPRIPYLRNPELFGDDSETEEMWSPAAEDHSLESHLIGKHCYTYSALCRTLLTFDYLIWQRTWPS